MTRTRAIACTALTFVLGFLGASATAYGYARWQAWHASGEAFQLGYIVGFLDATTLSKFRDPRIATIPPGGRPDYERWRVKVNEFFADPKNERREVVDAMRTIGDTMARERLRDTVDRMNRTPAPSASPP